MTRLEAGAGLPGSRRSQRWARASLIMALASAMLVASINLGLRIPGLGFLSPFAEAALLDYSSAPGSGFAPLDASYVARLLGLDTPQVPSTSGGHGRRFPRAGLLRRSIDPASIHSVPEPVPFTNDRFTDAMTVEQIPFTSNTTARQASRETGEPRTCSSSSGTAWYRYDTPAGGVLVANTFGTQGATTLGVFTGSDFGSMKKVACASGPSGNAQAHFKVAKGTRYYFQVASPGRRLVFNLGSIGPTQLVSVSSRGAHGNGSNANPVLSRDGRFVAFDSNATNLVPGSDRNCPTAPSLSEEVLTQFNYQVNTVCHQSFIYDRWTHKIEQVSVSSNGEPANGDSSIPSISGDGRYVVFSSRADNLFPVDGNPKRKGDPFSGVDVFVRDRIARTTTLVSVSDVPSWGPGNYDSYGGQISADGRYIAYQSLATDLVLGDTNYSSDAFVYDMGSGRTRRVSLTSKGAQIPKGGYVDSISADGRFVAFHSGDPGVVPGDTNGTFDVFVRDTREETTERVSLSSTGEQSNNTIEATNGNHFSADGRYIVFGSRASNLVPGDTNGAPDVFVRDRIGRKTYRVSVTSGGAEEPGDEKRRSHLTLPRTYSISDDGRLVVFDTFAPNMTTNDRNQLPDVFVHDLVTGATVLCSTTRAGDPGDLISAVPAISGDGRFMTFSSLSTNLVPGDTNPETDIFVHQLDLGP